LYSELRRPVERRASMGIADSLLTEFTQALDATVVT
jgi:hypothetical protein